MKNYVALRIYDSRRYRTETEAYEVQGQRPTDLNWETILRFDNKETAIEYAKQTAGFLNGKYSQKTIIWNTNGYGIKY